MKILAPVDSAKEAKLLIKSGAEELFCGYIPDEWVKKFKIIYGERVQTKRLTELVTVSINKRTNLDGNVRTNEELRGIASVVNTMGGKLFVTLNAFYYTEDQYQYLEEYINELSDAGVYGLIITDVALIRFVKEKFPNMYIVLSCCNQVANSYSASFFEKLGVDRITFPRHVTVDEIIDVTNNVPTVDYECFVLDSKCIYDDGNCRAMHNFGHFCMEQWDNDYYSTKNGDCVNYSEVCKVKSNESDFMNWSKPYLASNSKNNGWFAISCGACAVPLLIKHSKISTLKIAGRGLDTNSKIHMVRMVKKMIDIAKDDIEAIKKEKEYISKVVGVHEMCDLQSRCLMPSRHYN